MVKKKKINELYDIVSYAVENVGDNYEKGVNYLEVGKENSNGRRFKHSIEANKSLEEVLKEMGFTNFELKDKKRLVYNEINEEVSTKIINDAVDNMRSWGLEFPGAVHYFNRDPNNNYSRSMVKFLGIIEIVDYIFLFS